MDSLPASASVQPAFRGPFNSIEWIRGFTAGWGGYLEDVYLSIPLNGFALVKVLAGRATEEEYLDAVSFQFH